jgi:hypothetical protein
MTQEEKARAYDEAIERAQKATRAGSDVAMDIVQYIFPQLAESEDEQVRKGIVKFIVEQYPECWKDKKNKMLAYLEKQKEQKPLHWRRIEDATTQRTDDGCCVTSEKMLVKGWINDGDYRIVDEGTMVNRDILCIPVRELNAEQKPAEKLSKEEYVKKFKALCDAYDIKLPNREYDIYGLCEDLHKLFGDIQKPVEWDDYTKTNLDRALQIIKDAKGNLQGYQSDDGIYECDKAIECLEHFLYRGLEIEKSAEWSEEDRNIFDDILVDMADRREMFKSNGEIEFAEDTQKKIDWLSSHLPKFQSSYSQRKTEEWSEEDRNTLLMAATVLKTNFDSDEKFEDCDYDCETLAGKLLEMRYRTFFD